MAYCKKMGDNEDQCPDDSRDIEKLSSEYEMMLIESNMFITYN